MDNSHPHDRHGTGHGFLHLVLGCGLVVVAILVSSAVGANWGTALVVAALVLCPLSMTLMMRHMAGSPEATAPRRSHDHEPGT
jgi:predicted phage tail protein